MTTSETGALGLGPADQVAYVVADLDAALPTYEAIYGPFEVSEVVMEDCVTPEGPKRCELKVAVNNASPIELELLEVTAGWSPLLAHLEEHGEGIHHVRFRVESLDEKLAELEAAGFTPLLSKRFAPTIAFAYVQSPPAVGGSVIELLELQY